MSRSDKLALFERVINHIPGASVRAAIFATSLFFLLTSFAPAMATANPPTMSVCEGYFVSVRTASDAVPKAEALGAESRIEVRQKAQSAPTAAPSAAEISAEVKAVVDAVKLSILPRGFIGGRFSMHPAVASALGKVGIVLWDLRIYPAKNLSEAKAHAMKERDPLMQGIYIINKDLASDTEALTRIPAPEVFARLTATEDVYAFEAKPHYKLVNGVPTFVGNVHHLKPVKISREWIANNLDVSQMKWNLTDPEHGPQIKPSGYAFPKERGVILWEDTLTSKKTIGRVQKVADDLIAKGFKVTFNRDFQKALDMVRDQLRFVEGQWVKNSRYLEKVNYDNALESFKNGEAFSVEVWNPAGELVGTVIGYKHGNLYSPDSVGYNQSKEYKHPLMGTISIGFAKIALIALRDRLRAAEIFVIDAGMASAFTISVKGTTIPSDRFMLYLDALPPNAKVDLWSEWTSAEGRKFEEADRKAKSDSAQP